MRIERNHPHYKITIQPNDMTVFNKPFGDVPFTQRVFEFNYSDKVKEKDIPDALSNVLSVKKETVLKAWNKAGAHPSRHTGGGQHP